MTLEKLPRADKNVIAIAEDMAKNLFAEKVFIPLGSEGKSSETPLILVHPFYYGDEEGRQCYYDVFNCDLFNISRENYLENIRNLLSYFSGDIYLYESELRLPTTRRILLSTRKSLDGVYFIETLRDESNPANRLILGRDSNHLKDVASNFFFAGGRVVKYLSNRKMDGCLGGLVTRFNDSGINGDFVKGCCFV